MSWCLCVTLTAQTSRIDSLEQVLASGRLKNTEKAELLKNISGEYLFVDTTKSRMYALEAIQLAQSIGSKKIEAGACIALANTYLVRFDTAKFRTYALEALHLAQNNKGLELEEARVNGALGNYYIRAKQYYKAHDHYKKAEKLFLQLNNTKQLNNVYHNLCMLFQQIEDRENVIYYANKLLEMAIELEDPVMEIQARWFLVVSFDEDQDQEKLEYSLELYEKSLLLNTVYTEHFAGECGNLYLNLNRPREALPFLHRVRESYESGVRGGLSIAAVYFSLAEAYALLQQTDSAKHYLKKGQDGHVMFDRIRITIDYIRSLIEVADGDYRSALESFKKFHHLSDSIAKTEKTAEIARMRNWHELEQKNNENQLLQQEQQKQHRLIRILAGALVLILVLLAMSLFLYRKTGEKNGELKNLHTVKDKLFSVVAHDLRSPMGALMSILKLANENMMDAETQAQLLKDISARVDDTYGLLENLLHWSRSQMQGMAPAPVLFDAQEGSRAVTDSLQSIATCKNIILNNRIEKQQVHTDRDMFAVVVRNLTMNAIKYTPEVGEINLASELKDNMLVISVKDNGTGMSQEIQDKLFKLSETRSQRGTNNESGTGLGLVLCADFVKINGGSIWFSSKQGEGSTFFFSIPIK